MERGKLYVYDLPHGLKLGYEDYDVETFGGSDYEVSYTLDEENRNKVWKLLNAEGLTGSLEEMIITYFGEYMEKESFCAFCDEHGIKYHLFTWIS